MESSQTQPSPSIFLGIYLLFSIQSHPFPSLVAQSMFLVQNGLVFVSWSTHKILIH